jgi:hypothetical protein
MFLRSITGRTMQNHMEHQTSRIRPSAERGVAKSRPIKRGKAATPAILYFDGRMQCVVIRDISRESAKFDSAFGLKPGDSVTVEPLSRRRLPGTVVWSVAAFCGIEFDEQLSENDPVLTGS